MAMKSALLNRRVWTPAELNPQVWLDASDLSTFTLNVDKVSEWRDKSGNNRHVSQTSNTNRPSLSGGTVSFNGSNQWLTGSGFNNTTSMACLVRNGRTNTGAIILSTNNTASALSFVFSATGGTHYRCSPPTVSMTNYTHTPNTSVFDICVSNKNSLFSRNGSLLSARAGTAVPNMPAGFVIGRRVTNLYFLGDITEIILLENSLTTGQRQLLEGYLAFKGNRQESLPTNHPYKNTCPFI
jgi:hypothetical protein